MQYDFTSILDRHGRDSIAVDGLGRSPGFAPDAPQPGFDAIPMWVADMNFPTVPTVPAALIERASHPAYGYFETTEAYYDAIIGWQVQRNGCDPALLTRDCIGYENGVLGGVVSALTSFANPGDPILVHSPTYIGFTKSLHNNGFRIVHSPLVQDEQGVWRMDYADMDRKLKQYHIHVAILCSPHNPCGRADILLNGHKHIPTQSVSDDARSRTIALYAPSKTCNLAGLVGSYHLIYDTYLRDRCRARASKSHYNNMNVLSMHALIGAYQPEGYVWVDELCQVLSGNINFACDYIRDHFEGVEVVKPEGTYMLFVDCTKWCAAHGKTINDVEKAAWAVGVAIQDGRMFHGPCSVRMNLALPLSRVQEAFRRLDQYVFNA